MTLFSLPPDVVGHIMSFDGVEKSMFAVNKEACELVRSSQNHKDLQKRSEICSFLSGMIQQFDHTSSEYTSCQELLDRLEGLTSADFTDGEESPVKQIARSIAVLVGKAVVFQDVRIPEDQRRTEVGRAATMCDIFISHCTLSGVGLPDRSLESAIEISSTLPQHYVKCFSSVVQHSNPSQLLWAFSNLESVQKIFAMNGDKARLIYASTRELFSGRESISLFPNWIQHRLCVMQARCGDYEGAIQAIETLQARSDGYFSIVPSIVEETITHDVVYRNNTTESIRNDILERLRAMDPRVRRDTILDIVDTVFEADDVENVVEKIDRLGTYIATDIAPDVQHDDVLTRLRLNIVKIMRIVLKTVNAVFRTHAVEDAIETLDVSLMPGVPLDIRLNDRLSDAVGRGAPVDIAIQYIQNIRTVVGKEWILRVLAVAIAEKHGYASTIEILEEHLPRAYHFWPVLSLLKAAGDGSLPHVDDAHILLEKYDESELVERIRRWGGGRDISFELAQYYMATGRFEKAIEKAAVNHNTCIAIIGDIAKRDVDAALSLVPQLPEELRDDALVTIVRNGTFSSIHDAAQIAYTISDEAKRIDCLNELYNPLV